MADSEKEKIEKRAKAIAAMGLVTRDGDKFKVGSPSLRGRQVNYTVWRETGTPRGISGRVVCDCQEFKEKSEDKSFRCEHILAVKYSLVSKNTETAPEPETISIVAFFEEILDIALPEHQRRILRLFENGDKVRIFWTRSEIKDLKLKHNIEVSRKTTDSNPLTDKGFPSKPKASNFSDLVTAKQLGMIRAVSRELGIDADEECFDLMSCKTDELSKRAASALIQHLQDIQKEKNS